MAFSALWPLIANAAPFELSAPICSAGGARAAGAVGGPLPGQLPAPASGALPHCPFCLGVSDHAPGLAATPVMVCAVALPDHAPIYVQTIVWASFTHPYSHPRGPPVLTDVT